MMHWYGSDWGYLTMTVSIVVVWGLVIGAIVLVGRAVGRYPAPTLPAGPDPQQLLALRFARGEIDETEYRNRLATLGDTPASAR